MDRKAELEKKRKKLEELRKAKELKKQAKEAEKTVSHLTVDDGPVDELARERQDVGLLVDSLIGDQPVTGASSAASGGEIAERSPEPRSGAVSAEPTESLASRLSRLTISTAVQTNIPPIEQVFYTKETQTIETSFGDDEEEEDEILPAVQSQHFDLEAVDRSQEPQQHRDAEQRNIPELSEDDKRQILSSEDFVRFFDRASRLVMRALADTSDFTKDYAKEGKEEGESDSGADRLTFCQSFVDEHWSRHRGVMRLDWSTQHPELLLAAYNTNEEAHHDPDGVALVWNTKWNTQTPEYIFHCQSAVMSATFTNFHPNLVIGGTYSGQIVLWDNRSSKRTPVQRSPLSSNAHTHPVYCVAVVGTQNAHNLISTSTDGKLCSWSLDMLSQPQDKLELQYQTKSVAVTCMDFPPGEINSFVVGSEEGSVFMGSRLGVKAGISNHFDGHFGPITGIDFNSSAGRHDFSHLFLTSSFDWTVKLWSEKHSSPLHSFEDSGDYVFDVQWSPINPALFAAIDGTKRLDLWHINRDIEVPYCSETLDSVAAPNCVRWSKNGTTLAVGDADGKLHMYTVGEHIAQPKSDEWSYLRNALQEMQTRAMQPMETSLTPHTPL